MTFKEAIKNYLDKFAIEDEPFAVAYKNKTKSIDKCCSYIISEVSKMKKENSCVVLTDDEVFKMARHYYLDVNEEVNEEVNETPNVQVEVKETKSDPTPKKKEKVKDYDQFNIFDMLGE